MIANNIEHVREQIALSAQRVGRAPKDITLVAVTKTVPMEAITEAIRAGIDTIAENVPQQIRLKAPLLPKNISLHMIGQLQSNKVKYIIDSCTMVESLDRMHLAQEINKRAVACGKVMDALIQVNQTDDPHRGGISYDELPAFIASLSQLDHIRVRGLMCVAPITDEVRNVRMAFRRMRQVFDSLSTKHYQNFTPEILSMGMSGDYPIAIEEGATMVRIGSAIFGNRVK